MSTDIKDKELEVNSSEDIYTYKPRNRSNHKSNTSNKAEKNNSPVSKKQINKLAIIIPVGIVLLLTFAVIGYSMSLPKDKIANNIYVNTVHVGGMTEEAAKSAISQLIPEDAELFITSSGRNITIQGKDFGLSVDTEKTIENAISVCNSKNPFSNAYYAIKLLFTEHVIGVVPKFNKEYLDQILFDFGTTINGVSTEPEFIFNENSITLVPGTAGQNPDTSTARNQILQALSLCQFNNIDVTLDYAEPLKLNVDKIYDEFSQPAQDATYTITDDGEIKINSHKVYVEVEKNILEEAINKVNAGNEVTVSAKVTLPLKTTEMLEENLFTSTLGTYSSSFSTSSANRAHNVQKAATSINGKILMPGEEFSYNEAIGNPSAANGYKMASVFQNGKTAEGVGGGVCQVSSTLYNAVLYADLEVTERKNHSLTVGYVPNGQDATVSYGVLDFKFKNNTDYPVKIVTSSENRKLIVSIIGGAYNPSRTVTISNTVVSTISPQENITINTDLPAGTKIVTSTGKNGYVVDTYKTVYENGVKVSSKKITRSTYRAVNTEITAGPSIDENLGTDEIQGENIPTNNTVLVPNDTQDTQDITTDVPMPDVSENTERPVIPENNLETSE